MSLAWVAEQIRIVRESSGTAPPMLIRFNPSPPGVIREGSATSAVLDFLRSHPVRYFQHWEIVQATQRTKVAVDWACIYLRSQGLIEAVADGRNSRYFRYGLKKEPESTHDVRGDI